MSALPPARNAALKALRLVAETDRPVQEVLDSLLPEMRDPRDRTLATHLTYSVLRHRSRLDAAVERFLTRPEGLPAEVRLVLRLAAGELLFLHRVPSYATLDWAVTAVRRRSGPRLAGLANAVLRRVSELGQTAHDFSFYRKGASFPEAAARFYSAPLWLVHRLLDQFGQETALRYLEAGVDEPPLGLRINRRHPSAASIFASLASQPACLAQDYPGLMLHHDHDLDLAALLSLGVASRQSFAAQQILALSRPEEWEGPVWDACAGRGGKTLSLAERGVSPLVASDMHAGRLAGLNREALRLGLPAVPVFRWDATRPPPLRQAPRTVLLDAPCSGLGVLSRRPDSKWRRTPEDVRDLVALQRCLLETAWALLPPGGRLIYITCTILPEENEAQVEGFLQAHSGAREELRHATPPASPAREQFFGSVLRKGG